MEDEYNTLLEMLKAKYLVEMGNIKFQQDRIEERLFHFVEKGDIDINFVLKVTRDTSIVLNKKYRDVKDEYTRAVKVANDFYNCMTSSVVFDERIYIMEML